ncbi:MAG: CUB domain-containing protein [Saprospiraceae bacterium]
MIEMLRIGTVLRDGLRSVGKLSLLLVAFMVLSYDASACDKNTFAYSYIDNGNGTWTLQFTACMEVSNNNGCGGPQYLRITGLAGVVSGSPSNWNFPNGTTWNLATTTTSAEWTGTALPSTPSGGLSNPECMAVTVVVNTDPAGDTFTASLGHDSNGCGGICSDNYTFDSNPITPTLLTCPDDANFYDSGGAGSNYGNNQNEIYTICTDDGSPVTVTFSAIDLNETFGACEDFLFVFDGSDLSAPALATLCGESNSALPASFTSTGDCLTFNFVSDGSSVRAGWAAAISCAAPCSADAGTITMSGAGVTNTGSNEYDIDFGTTGAVSVSGFTLPSSASPSTAGMVLAIFDCPPTSALSSPWDIQNDPCYLGIQVGNSINTTNDGSGTSALGTVYAVYFTFDAATGASTGPDENGDDCVAFSDVITINYSPPSFCDCTTPDCPAGGYPDASSVQFADCETFSPTLTNQTFTTCHVVTSDDNGFLGVVQSVGMSPPFGACADNILASRTASLFAMSGGSCSGGAIPPTVANGGNSATFNPEWSGLSPNTDYVICITITIGSGCSVNQVCVDYYGEPSPLCGDCSDPTCPIEDVGTFAMRNTTVLNPALQGYLDVVPDATGTYTTCHQVTTTCEGSMGIVQGVGGNNPICGIDIADGRSVNLYPVGSCGSGAITPDNPNANSLGSGFNPEWYDLMPETDYIVCITYSIPPGCLLEDVVTNYYHPLPDNAPSAPPTPTGPSPVCAGDMATYTITAVSGATSYNWTVTGGTIDDGQGTTSIDVTWSGAGGSVCVVASNSCGDSPQTCLTVSGINNEADVDPISDVCFENLANFTPSLTSSTPGGTWSITPSGTINASSGAITASSLSAGTTYTVTYTVGTTPCQAMDSESFTVTEEDMPTPPTITVCASDAATYNLTQHNASVGTGTVTWYDGEPGNGGVLISPATSVDLNSVTDLWVQLDSGNGCQVVRWSV